VGEQPPKIVDRDWNLIDLARRIEVLEMRFDALCVRLDVMGGKISMVNSFQRNLDDDVATLKAQVAALMEFG